MVYKLNEKKRRWIIREINKGKKSINDIIFIPSCARHPQTNGKNEKWFDVLEKEFDERFETIDKFIEWYNDERLSEAVD